MIPYISLGKINILIYPIVMTLAVLVCAVVMLKNKRIKEEYYETFLNASVIAICGAFLVGKIIYILNSVMQGRGIYIFPEIIFGGFVFYGGLIGGILGIYAYTVCSNRNFLEYCDVFATVLPLGQAIGRIGCFFNGCCYGCAYDGIFAVKYNIGAIEKYVFPTWFAEAFFCLLLFFYLYKVCNNIRIGNITARYLVLYSFFRFYIEFLRGDDVRGIYGLFSFSQYISMIAFVCGIIIFVVSRKNKQNCFLERKDKNGF